MSVTTTRPRAAARTDSDHVERLARALGWASVGLGLPQLLRPGAVTRAVGVGDGAKQQAVTAAVGARELVHAAGLLTPRIGARWVWTRVVGDAVDLATLARALRRHDGKGLTRTAAATAAVVGIAAVDAYTAIRQLRTSRKENTVDLTASTTVGKAPQEVYAFWRRLEHLPDFMAHVEHIRVESDTRSHWRVTAPFGQTVEWDAEITDDAPGQSLAWKSVEGADISPAMLDVARKRLPGVPLHLADMRKLDLGRRFDAVICLFSSIGYITDRSELTSTVERLAAHVGPGGVLVIDGWIRPDKWSDDYRGDPDIASDHQMTVVRLTVSRRVGNVTELDMHHLVRDGSGIEYFVESHRLALTPTEEYVSAVENAGLKARVVPDFMPARDRIVGTRNPA